LIDIKVKIPAAGAVDFSGFYGDYDVEVEADGKIMRGEIKFSRHGSGKIKAVLQ
jgi:hypothetical protein